MLKRPLDSLDEYVAYFTNQPFPVLKHTVKELDQMRADMSALNGRHIATVVLQDPMLTLQVLTYIESHRRQSQNHDITTIDRAIMMLGIEPFFRMFSNLPTIEDQLHEHPKALVGVLKVIGRARHAAHFAREWATLRHDMDVDEVTVAALLRDATEILCWCFAPELTLQVYTKQLADRTLRSVIAQRSVFNFTANEIQRALVKAWHLPELLVSFMDEDQINNPRVQTVKLAIDLARHYGHGGWDNAAVPDDVRAVSKLLKMRPEAVLHKLHVPADTPLVQAFLDETREKLSSRG